MKMENYEKFKKMVNEIKQLDTYKEILEDSFGGIMFNIENKNKYNNKIKLKFERLEKQGFDIYHNTDGIFRGVYHFIMRD